VDGPGFESLKKPREFFFIFKNVQTVSEAKPAGYLMGIRARFWGSSGQGGRVHHTSPSSSEVKNEWSYTSTSPVSLLDADNESFTISCSSPTTYIIQIVAARNFEVDLEKPTAYSICTLVIS
jgi:hypothetical protein